MAYFSTGSEGYDYEERYCERCIHYPKEADAPFCSIWNAHLLYNSEQQDSETVQAILGLLIPRRKDGFADQCSMFVEEK